MLRALTIATILLTPSFVATAEPPPAQPKVGDTYQISSERKSEQQTDGGSSGSNSDRDIVMERVVGVRPDGLELEYDLPDRATAEERAGNWQLPARIFKPLRGSPQLLNGPELSGRVDDWLKRGGMTRAACGHLIFTWNAFRIECDPQSALKILNLFDMGPNDLREGGSYRPAEARGPGSVKRTKSGPDGATYTVALVLDPETVRRERVQSDLGVAEILRKPLTLDAARLAHATEDISGTMAITFETNSTGTVMRRTDVTQLMIKSVGGKLETMTTTQILERKPIVRALPANSV